MGEKGVKETYHFQSELVSGGGGGIWKPRSDPCSTRQTVAWLPCYPFCLLLLPSAPGTLLSRHGPSSQRGIARFASCCLVAP